MSTRKIAVSIPDHVFTHPAFRALPPLERCLVVELLALAKRIGTDEPLTCSVDMARLMCNVPRSVAARALLGIRERGFIAVVKPGDRQRGARGRMATEWRLTCLPYRGEPPTAEYNRVHWKAQDQIALSRNRPSSNAPSGTSRGPEPVQEEEPGNGKFPSYVSPQRDQIGQDVEIIEYVPPSILSRQRHKNTPYFVPGTGLIESKKTQWRFPWLREISPGVHQLMNLIIDGNGGPLDWQWGQA